MTLKAYTLPLVISLSLHALVFGLMFANWSARPETREVQRPQAIQAKIVEFTPKSQRQAEQAAQQKVIDMRQRQQERERQEAERRRQQQEARRAQAQKEKAEQEKAQREREARAKAERERKQREQEAAERRRQQELQAEQERIERQQQLEQALSEEAEFFEAQQSQEVAQSYVGVIRQRIANNWSRPPSARTGMEVVLAIQLVPTGQVVDVTVVESSGNSAFDRSAVQAVKRIDRFEEVQDMPSHVFESHFRQLTLKFKPEDLRL